MSTMNVPDSGGGASNELTALLSFLQRKLGGLYFDNPGTPPADKAFQNLIRLRALFEKMPEGTARDQLLKEQQGRDLVTIHNLTYGLGDPRITEATEVLFGFEGRQGVNVKGLIGEGSSRGDSRAMVDQQWASMESAGGVKAVASPSAQEDPTGVLAPEPTQGADVDEIRAGNQQGLTNPGARSDAEVGDIHAGHAHGGGGNAGSGTLPVDGSLPTGGTARQVPGGHELWRVDNGAVYLAYRNPKRPDLVMTWKVENPDRLKAIFGDSIPAFDKELTAAEYKRLSPWYGGLTAEIRNADVDPWQQFDSDFAAAAELRPWLRDMSVQAVMQVAYLEGRAPTSDELSQTDWWNEHTADERAWMEESVTLGQTEVERRRDDASRSVQETLREAGMNNVPKHIADYIAEQRLTGKWSETYANEQVRKLSDPYAPGKLDKGLLAMIRDPDLGSTADARAIAGGKDTLKARIKEIFGNARVDLAKHGDGSAADPEQRLDRLAQEVLSGVRTLTDIRQSVDLLAAKTPGGRPGGLDTNIEGEDRVRNLLREWVGPSVAAGYDDKWIAEQAGLLRNDPDYEQVLVQKLQQVRLASFGNWTDPSLRYEDIAPIARSLFSRVWGQTPDETDPLFMDVVNMQDQNAAAAKLRTEGINKGVGKVVDDALAGLADTSLGQQVVRSTV